MSAPLAEDRTRPPQAEAGWRATAGRLWQSIGADNLGMIAAGAAFYMLLALFPALATLVSVYGLAADRASVESLVDLSRVVLPPEANAILADELGRLVGAPSGGLSATAALSFLFTLWSAHNGATALLSAVTVAYRTPETRSVVLFNLIAFAFTLGAILFIIAALVLVAVLPAVIDLLPMPAALRDWLALLRWPLLGALVMAGMAALYRFGPPRAESQWRCVLWGALGATVLWVAMSLGFSAYVRQFASYDKTYGSLGAVVVLLMWFYLSAYIVLLGAEVNAEIAHRPGRSAA